MGNPLEIGGFAFMEKVLKKCLRLYTYALNGGGWYYIEHTLHKCVLFIIIVLMKKSIIARILSPLALLALAAFVFIQVPSVHAQTITSTPCYQFVTNLTIGSTGADVVALQKLLISKGFSLPSIQAGFAQYGYFGVETQSAVKKYQASVGIEATGYLGVLTRASLNACSGSVPIGSATLRVSASDRTPKSRLVVANMGSAENQYDQLSVLAFDVKADGDSVMLETVIVDLISVTKYGRATAPTAYLYDGSTQIDSTSIINGRAVFTNVDLSIGRDQTKTYVVKVDIVNASQHQVAFTASVDASQFVVSAGSGNYLNKIGTAIGGTFEVRDYGPEITLVSKSITTSDTSQPSVSVATARFNVKIRAVGGDIMFGTVASTSPLAPASSFVVYANGVPTAIPIANKAVSYETSSSGFLTDGLTNSFILQENNEITISIVFRFVGRNADGSYFPGGSYAVSFDQIHWSGMIETPQSNMNGKTDIITDMNGDADWRTSYVFLPGNGSDSQQPSVNLKVNGSSGPLTVAPLSTLNFSWTWTSANFDRCYASSQVPGWNNYTSRATSSSMSIGAPASAGTFVYSLTCLKANPYPMDNSYATSTVTVNVVATTSTPSITVLSPNGGETWTIGSTQDIRWSSKNFASSEKIEIRLISNEYLGTTDLISGTLNDGQESIIVPNVAPGTKYGIQIYSKNNASVVDTNDFHFTITAPTTNLPPVITSVAGKAAGNFEIDAGGSVGIQGTNLAGYKDSTNVYIGGMACTITQLSNTLIYCTAPSNLTVGSTYDLYINTVGSGGDKVTSNIVRVKVLSKLSTNRPPAINGITAPTVLKVNETGTWSITASDPENGSLSYSIDWGEAVCPTGYVCTASSGSSFSQTSSFTHSYASPGIYTVKVTVTDAAGLKAQTSSTVRVDAIPMPLRTINVTSPTTGSVFDNGSSQNVIAGWQADTGDFDSYNVSIGNSGANVEKLISTGISKFSNGFSTTAGTLKDAISSVSGKVAPESGYYFVITAIKNDAAGGGIVARGNGASFKIVTPTTVVCPVGYICTPAGQPTACPAGSTCAPTTLSCPSGYTCYTKTLTTPTVTATTPYITIVSPRYENLKIGVKHQIKWKDSREKGKGLSPVYTIMIAGSNGKELVVENLATSKWCDDIQCYYDWTPTTASTNNQISIYDIANDPNQALVGRSTIFNIEAGSPVSQKTIKLNASIWEAVKSYFKGTR